MFFGGQETEGREGEKEKDTQKKGEGLKKMKGKGGKEEEEERCDRLRREHCAFNKGLPLLLLKKGQCLRVF